MQETGSSRAEVLRALVTLSVPAVIEHIMSTLMQYVDTAMVGHLSEQATAAVSMTVSVTWLVNSVPFAVSTASLAVISRANGAGDKKRVRVLTGQSALYALVIGTIMMFVCLFFAPHIPVWMGAEEAVRGPASLYFSIVSLSMVMRSFMFVFGAAIRATKDTKTPMKINMTANVLNVVLNYLLIYTAGLGVTGAAIATAVAYCAAGAAMFAAARRKEVLRWSREEMIPNRDDVSRFFGIALPTMGASAASFLGHVFFAGLVSGMGTTTFAAHSIALSAEELFYIPGLALRTSTSALIGNALGERNDEKLRNTEHLSILLTISLMFLSGLTLFLVAYPLMRLFTISDRVALLGASMLRLVAFSEPFFGLMIVLEGIFYGKGKAKGIFFVETASMWGIRILFTFLCVKVWHLPLRAVWLCMIADNVCKALCLLVLYLYTRQRDLEAKA